MPMLSRTNAEKKGYKILTGPRGGSYVLTSGGAKIYIEKEIVNVIKIKPKTRPSRKYRAPKGAYGRFLQNNVAIAS